MFKGAIGVFLPSCKLGRALMFIVMPSHVAHADCDEPICDAHGQDDDIPGATSDMFEVCSDFVLRSGAYFSRSSDREWLL